jgi:hypothetical protein
MYLSLHQESFCGAAQLLAARTATVLHFESDLTVLLKLLAYG